MWKSEKMLLILSKQKYESATLKDLGSKAASAAGTLASTAASAAVTVASTAASVSGKVIAETYKFNRIFDIFWNVDAAVNFIGEYVQQIALNFGCRPHIGYNGSAVWNSTNKLEEKIYNTLFLEEKIVGFFEKLKENAKESGAYATFSKVAHLLNLKEYAVEIIKEMKSRFFCAGKPKHKTKIANTISFSRYIILAAYEITQNKEFVSQILYEFGRRMQRPLITDTLYNLTQEIIKKNIENKQDDIQSRTLLKQIKVKNCEKECKDVVDMEKNMKVAEENVEKAKKKAEEKAKKEAEEEEAKKKEADKAKKEAEEKTKKEAEKKAKKEAEKKAKKEAGEKAKKEKSNSARRKVSEALRSLSPLKSKKK